MEREVLRSAIVVVRRRDRLGRAQRAFTLVELAIVVAIVGILAVIAVVSYRRYILVSKISEAESTVQAIRIAQEDHRAETGHYADIGAGGYCPTGAGDGKHKYAWTRSCSASGTLTWAELPVHVDGPVLFGFATYAGAAGIPPTAPAWVTWPASPRNPWFVVMARCDMDGDTSNFTELASSSFENNVRRHAEGL